MDCNVFCGTCWSKMTRLLNTAIIGATVEIVTSSSVDMLAGLSRWEIWRTPPGFCADVAPAMRHTTSSPAAPATTLRQGFIGISVNTAAAATRRRRRASLGTR